MLVGFDCCRTTIVNSLQAGIVGLPNVGKVRRCLMAAGMPGWQPYSSASSVCAGLVGHKPQTLACFFTAVSFVLQSTLFNAIVENGKAAAANFPFCTIEPNVGMVTVPDTRLQQLSDISKSKDTVRVHLADNQTQLASLL